IDGARVGAPRWLEKAQRSRHYPPGSTRTMSKRFFVSRLPMALAVLLVAALAAGSRAPALRAANAPHIDGINPTSGPPGTSVTITGTDFVPGNTGAAFGSAGITASCSTTTTCTVTAPPPVPANPVVSVTVTTTAGTSNAVIYTYT